MNKEKEEYIALRQEINTLCAAADNIVYILYVFLTTYLSFALTQKDTIYILLTHIVILPLYLLAMDRRIASCKISAYISVFHENKNNKWETRLINYKGGKDLSFFRFFSSKHFPFLFSNFAVLIIFLSHTVWNYTMSFYEILKLITEALLFSVIFVIFLKYKKISVADYIEGWKTLKEIENNTYTQKCKKSTKKVSKTEKKKL
ncbi:MAG: hypothetical protein HFJ08_09705 [Lachnospiraceae bacterium]|nr:hypothetical protein [Lachnospiraceae bacterium]